MRRVVTLALAVLLVCLFSVPVLAVGPPVSSCAGKGSGFLVPPPPWRVGTLVAVHVETFGEIETVTHVVEFPGAPEEVDCTDNPHPAWCLTVPCAAVNTSTYACLTPPMLDACLAYEVADGVAVRITDINPDACKVE